MDEPEIMQTVAHLKMTYIAATAEWPEKRKNSTKWWEQMDQFDASRKSTKR